MISRIRALGRASGQRRRVDSRWRERKRVHCEVRRSELEASDGGEKGLHDGIVGAVMDGAQICRIVGAKGFYRLFLLNFFID